MQRLYGREQELRPSHTLHPRDAARIRYGADVHIRRVEVLHDVRRRIIQQFHIRGLCGLVSILADVAKQDFKLALKAKINPLVDRGKDLQSLFDQRKRGANLPIV